VLLVRDRYGCSGSVFASLDVVCSWARRICSSRELLREEMTFLIPCGCAPVNDQPTYTTGVNSFLIFVVWQQVLPPNTRSCRNVLYFGAWGSHGDLVGWRRLCRHRAPQGLQRWASGPAALKPHPVALRLQGVLGPVALKLQGVTEPVELNLQGTCTGNRVRYRWRVRGFRAHKYRLHITVE